MGEVPPSLVARGTIGFGHALAEARDRDRPFHEDSSQHRPRQGRVLRDRHEVSQPGLALLGLDQEHVGDHRERLRSWAQHWPGRDDQDVGDLRDLVEEGFDQRPGQQVLHTRLGASSRKYQQVT